VLTLEDNAEIKDAISNFIISLEEEQKKEIEEQKKKKEDISGENNKNNGFEKAVKIIEKITKYICPGERINLEKDSKNLKVYIYGKDLSILIGKNGKTIDAIEYLVNLAAKRKKILDKTITIDVKNYRKQNIEKINNIALKMAEKALKENRNIVLRPMPSHERKIVHDLLSKIKDIKTISRDAEPNRRIVIYPLNNQR
jgi:spoIIIJ-associated protein